MTYLKWSFYALVALALAALLHYSLPSRDIVYITGQDVKRVDSVLTDADGREISASRDVSFIYAAFPDGSEIVYRNEDTDLGWPPYLKFDTATISSRAENAVSSRAAPEWKIVTHYGWRFEFLSMFENVVAIEDAESPEQSLVPWFNIAVIALLVALLLTVRWYLVRKYERHIEPLIDGDPNT